MRAMAFIMLTTAGTRAWWAWEANHTNVTTPPPTAPDPNGSVSSAPSWFPGFGSTPIGDPPPGSENLTEGALNWGAWGFTVLFGWVDTRVFSTPSSAGMLNTEGGWALYALDRLGLFLFGSYWPVVGWMQLTILLVGILVGLGWFLKVFDRCCCWICKRPARRHPPAPAGVVGLPEQAAPKGFQPLYFVGPAGGRACDTEYFQKEVRGRGSSRKPNDLVVKLPTGAARLQLDPDRLTGPRNRIDRHGLWVGYSRVLGVSSHKVRGDLEKADVLHLCRASERGGGEGLHCKCSAVVDAEGLVDLGAHGGFTPWRCLVLVWRVGARTVRWASRCCLGFFWVPRRRRASGSLGRQIQDEGVLRALDPDSESEAEFIPDRCEAVLVGLELQGRPRALASEGCMDKAAPEPTRLMTRDQELSDLGGKEVARLCSHLCKKHLSDAARSPSPSSARTPQVDSASLSSVLRSQLSQPAKPDTPRGRSVNFPEEPAATSSAPTSRKRRSAKLLGLCLSLSWFGSIRSLVLEETGGAGIFSLETS